MLHVLSSDAQYPGVHEDHKFWNAVTELLCGINPHQGNGQGENGIQVHHPHDHPGHGCQLVALIFALHTELNQSKAQTNMPFEAQDQFPTEQLFHGLNHSSVDQSQSSSIELHTSVAPG